MGCFSPILFLATIVFVLVSLIRWFEQTTEAVDRRDWSRLLMLLIMPFSVWVFKSRVAAGRPTPVPKHEPVRGFGSVGKSNVARLEGLSRKWKNRLYRRLLNPMINRRPERRRSSSACRRFHRRGRGQSRRLTRS